MNEPQHLYKRLRIEPNSLLTTYPVTLVQSYSTSLLLHSRIIRTLTIAASSLVMSSNKFQRASSFAGGRPGSQPNPYGYAAAPSAPLVSSIGPSVGAHRGRHESETLPPSAHRRSSHPFQPSVPQPQPPTHGWPGGACAIPLEVPRQPISSQTSNRQYNPQPPPIHQGNKVYAKGVAPDGSTRMLNIGQLEPTIVDNNHGAYELVLRSEVRQALNSIGRTASPSLFEVNTPASASPPLGPSQGTSSTEQRQLLLRGEKSNGTPHPVKHAPLRIPGSASVSRKVPEPLQLDDLELVQGLGLTGMYSATGSSFEVGNDKSSD
ncbi:hypothetical protein CTheo_3820 [Ceratobasidium theobromae]|uniref:Uncharacterized protein n=1 Tax=Ceratobasidium theobromae TaxID=1582974 RepID=A0A5N5QLT7_9AGAM|nr:hypothetical protein CTheo_3820 [Ceratobasidium theobromae]